MVTQNLNWPLIDEAVAFGTGPRDPQPAPYWVSMIERSRQTYTTTRGRQYETDQTETGTADVVWHNNDGALDPLNTGSPFYPRVIEYRAYRRRAQYPATINVLTADQATAGAVAGTYGASGPGTAPLAVGTLPLTVAAGGIYALTTTAGPVYSTSLPTTPVSGTVLTQLFGASALPGQAFTAQCAVTNSVSASMKLAIVWVDVNGATLSTSTGTPSTGTTSRIISVTGTCPSNACGMILELVLNSSPGSVSTVTSINWQLERNGSASGYVQPNLWYPIFTGYVERWPLTWASDGLYGLCSVTAVDAFGYLSQQILRSPAYMEALVMGAAFLFCLDESDTSTQFTDATGARAPMTSAIYNAAGGAAAGAVSGGNQLNSPTTASGIGGPVVSFANVPNGVTNAVLNLGVTSATIGPSLSAAWTRFFAFRCPAPVAGDQTIWSTFFAISSAAGTIGYQLYIGATTGHLNFLSSYNGGASTGFVGGSTNVADGNWHVVSVSMSADGKTAHVYLDNALMGTATTASDMRPQTIGSAAMETLGADVTGLGNLTGFGYTGDLAWCGELPFAVTTAQASLLYSTFAFGGSGLGTATSATRWADFLRWLQYSAPQAADNYTTGETVAYGPASEIIGTRDSSGTDGVTALQTVVDTETGADYVSAGGVVTLKARRARYNQNTPKVVFGENPTGSGEIPYAGDVAFGNDPTRVITDAQFTQTSTGTVTTYLDQAAIAVAGDISAQRNINTLNSYEISDAAQYAVTRNKTAHQRLQQLHINVGSQPTAAVWLAMLTGELGDFVQVLRRPRTPAATITLNGFIEQINWTMGGADAGVDLQISPYLFQQFWQMGSIALTLKNAVVSVGATTAVINPLADAATNPIQANISSAGQPFEWIIEPGTAKEELVTVTFPTAGSTGYTSATLNIGTCLRTDTGATGTGFRFTHSIGAVLQDIGGFAETPAYTIAALRALLAAGTLNTYDLLGSTTVMGY